MRQSLNRQDFPSIDLRREDKARVHGLTIQQNGAGAAFADFAAPFCTGEAKLIPQNIEERQVWPKIELVATAVDRCLDEH